MKYTIIAMFWVVSTVGCATAFAKAPDEVESEIRQLVLKDDKSTIESYFHKYGESNPFEKGKVLQITVNDVPQTLTYEKFLDVMQTDTENIDRTIKRCATLPIPTPQGRLQCLEDAHVSKWWVSADSQKRFDAEVATAKSVATDAANAAAKKKQEGDAANVAKRAEQQRLCDTNHLNFVTVPAIRVLNRFRGKAYWAETQGLSAFGMFVCWNKKASSKPTFSPCAAGGNDSCAVVEGIEGELQRNYCGNEFLVYSGVTDSRDENGFNAKVPVWKVIPHAQAKKIFKNSPFMPKKLGLSPCSLY